VVVMRASQLGIQLSADDVDNITPFLDGLAGEQLKLTYPILPPSSAGKPATQSGERMRMATATAL
jgi:cytochrome c peroxidase